MYTLCVTFFYFNGFCLFNFVFQLKTNKVRNSDLSSEHSELEQYSLKNNHTYICFSKELKKKKTARCGIPFAYRFYLVETQLADLIKCHLYLHYLEMLIIRE